MVTLKEKKPEDLLYLGPSRADGKEDLLYLGPSRADSSPPPSPTALVAPLPPPPVTVPKEAAGDPPGQRLKLTSSIDDISSQRPKPFLPPPRWLSGLQDHARSLDMASRLEKIKQAQAVTPETTVTGTPMTLGSGIFSIPGYLLPAGGPGFLPMWAQKQLSAEGGALHRDTIVWESMTGAQRGRLEGIFQRYRTDNIDEAQLQTMVGQLLGESFSATHDDAMLTFYIKGMTEMAAIEKRYSGKPLPFHQQHFKPSATLGVGQDLMYQLRYYFQQGAQVGPADLYQFFDKTAQFIHEKTGLSKGGLFKSLEELVRPAVELDPRNIPERAIGMFASGITGELPKFLLTTAAAGGNMAAGFAMLMGLESAIDGGSPQDVLTAIAKGGLLGKSLHAAGLLTRPGQVTGFSVVGGAHTAAEGGAPEEIAASALTMSLFAMASPKGKKDLSQAVQDIGVAYRGILNDSVKTKISTKPPMPEPSLTGQDARRAKRETAKVLRKAKQYRGQPVEAREGVASIAEEVVPYTPERVLDHGGAVEKEKPPVAPASIASWMSEKLGLSVRYGKMSDMSIRTLGYFMRKPEAIRIRHANDMGTIAHEIGHALHKRLFPRVVNKGGPRETVTYDLKPFQPFADELKPLATAGHPIQEGMAEFFRLYVTEPTAARTLAPRMYAWFDGFLAQHHPEIRNVALQARQDYIEFMQLPAQKQLELMIEQGEPSRVRQIVAKAVDVVSRFEEYALDRVIPIRDAVRELNRMHNRYQLFRKDRTAREVEAKDDPYILARLFAGSPKKIKDILEYGMIDLKNPIGERLSDGLNPVLREIPITSMKPFTTWMVARRMVEDILPRVKREKMALPVAEHIRARTGLSEEQWVSIYRAKERDARFNNWADRIRQFQQEVYKAWATSYGFKSGDVETLIEANNHYIPLHRVMDEPSYTPSPKKSGAGKAFVGLPKPGTTKRAKGSARQIRDPIAEIYQNTFLLLDLAERNYVARALIDLVEGTEGGGIVARKLKKTRKEKTEFPLREIKAHLESLLREVTGEPYGERGGPEVPHRVLDMYATIWRTHKQRANPKDREISVWKDGEEVVYEIDDPALASAIYRLDPVPANIVVKLLRPFSQSLRLGATLTAEFMARNPIRDVWSAAMYSNLGVKMPYYWARGLFDVLEGQTQKGNAMYSAWIQSGGSYGSALNLTKAEIEVRQLRLATGQSTASRWLAHPVEALKLLAQITEESTRVGVFRGTLGGGSMWESPKPLEKATLNDLYEAGMMSRQASVDFQRQGAKVAGLAQITAFWNANIQGVDLWRGLLQKHPKRTVLYMLAGITAPSVLLQLAQLGDVRLEEIPQWQKDISWIILTGPRVTREQWDTYTTEQQRALYEHTIYRLPKPFTQGVIMGSIPERIIDWWAGQYTTEELPGVLLQTLGAAGVSAVVPNITFLAPIIENMKNLDTWRDRPLESRALQELSPELRQYPSTTAIATRVSQLMSMIVGKDTALSPIKIENLIQGWGGPLTMQVLRTADQLAQRLLDPSAPARPEESWTRLPGIKGFTIPGPPPNPQSVTALYELYRDSERAVADYKALLKTDPDEAERFAEEHEKLLEQRRFLQESVKVLGAVSNEKTSIYASDLTGEEKRGLLIALALYRMEFARQRLEQLRPPAIDEQEAARQ